MFARSLLTAAAAIFLAHPTSAQAHRRLELAVTLGAYVPTRHLPIGPWSDFSSIACIDVCETPTERQRRATALGGRVTAWLGTRGAIEGSFWYAPSGVTGWERVRGNIDLASVHLVLSLAPRAPTVSPLLLAGPAVIHRSGDAYTDVRGTTSPGGALGMGVGIHPGRRVACRVQVEDYLYRVKFASRTVPGVSEWEFQHDFVFSLSVSPVGRR